jgi:phage terminase large subunit-like protein
MRGLPHEISRGSQKEQLTNQEQAEAEGCYYDQAEADKAVKFMERYALVSSTGKRMKLLPWQRDLVEQLYGNRNKSGSRQYKRAILSMAKKNGKNQIAAAICLYELYGSGTPSPFVVSASTARENASQLHREIAYSIRNNPKLLKLAKITDSTKEIRVASKNGRYKSFSADAGSAEGENISCLVIDELHAHSDNGKLYRSLEYATISRPNSLVLIISTSGHDQSTLWYDLFRFAQSVQKDEVIDTSLLARIYSAPLESDNEDPATWHTSNPSLGVSFSEDDFRKDYQRAKNEGNASLTSWKRYRLNQWVVGDDCYIDPTRYDRCLSPMTDDELRPFPLYVGVDLSQTVDPCSVACVWALPERKFYVRAYAWVCEEGCRQREETNLPKYRQYEQEKVMTVTQGTANDYRRIKSYLLDLKNKFRVQEIIFDQYNALEMATELVSEGITVFRQPQNHKYYTGPTKEFGVAIDEQRIKHDGNKLLRWALSNTRLDYDAYENVKPSRDRSTDKIDPAIATIMAYGRACTSNVTLRPRTSVYDNMGVFAV